MIEWEGGTVDTYRGVTHVFRNLPLGADLHLTVKVVQTDFSAKAEFVNGIFANGQQLLRSCNPGVDNIMQFFVCLVNRNVSALVDDGVLNVTTTATSFVNMNPYEGNLLHVRYTVTDSLFPTAAPSNRPSVAPTVKGSSPAPSFRPSRRPTPSAPTLFPTTPQPTRVPNRGSTFDLSVEVGTTDVTEGVTYTFFGVNETTVGYVEVDVLQTDFNDADEYINEITVNDQVVSTFCNPNGQATQIYSNCLRNYEVYGTQDATITLTVRATPKVNCCPYQGQLLYVRISLTHFEKPTVMPTRLPSSLPTVSPSANPSATPSLSPTKTNAPTTLSPSYAPTVKPSYRPTSTPSTEYPTITPGFSVVFEGGTNDVRSGVSHTFVGLLHSPLFLRVEVYPTDFSDVATEYIDRIRVNGRTLSSFCFPGQGSIDDFFVCLYSTDVASLVNSIGELTVVITASEQVNSYPKDGYLLFVRLTISDTAFPSPLPTSMPSGTPSNCPSGSPSEQPIGEPTGAPSRRPVLAPTSRPSGNPTGRPSSIPSQMPSADPSGKPTPVPSISPTTDRPTFAPNAWFEWIPIQDNMVLSNAGHRVYEWADDANWNIGNIPGLDYSETIDKVSIHLNSNEAILIRDHITVRNLNITGFGSIYFTGSNASITVTENWICSMQNGRLSSIFEDESSQMRLLGYSEISALDTDSAYPDTLTITRIHILNEGELNWRNGNIIGFNATIENDKVGSVRINAVQDMSLLTDISKQQFIFYPHHILNVAADLHLNLPAGQAIRDIIVPDNVRLRQGRDPDGESTSTEEIWAIKVVTSDESMNYYEKEVNFTQQFAGFNFTNVYEKSFVEVATSYRCAELCLSFSWCVSFDFLDGHRVNVTCLLSRYYGFEVGGLTGMMNSLSPTFAHHELDSQLGQLSNISLSAGGGGPFRLINYGDMLIAGGREVTMDVFISAEESATITIVHNASVVLKHGAILADSASLNICSGSVTVSGGVLSANSSDVVLFSDCSMRGVTGGMLKVSGSDSAVIAHNIAASLSNIYLHLDNGAAVYMYHRLGVDVRFNELRISGGSSLLLFGLPSLADLGTLLNVSGDVIVEGDGSEILARNLTIFADTVTVGVGARISSSGLGFSAGEGIGPGSNHSYSASGGSHGGLGGPGLVDAIGPSYGSTLFPTDFGSGGGSSLGGPSPTVGGAGGGALWLQARIIIVNGTMSSDGVAPSRDQNAARHDSGAGGGAGGSIFVKAVESFSGFGSLSAVGGDGMFAGTSVSGGGGSGGRIAIHCDVPDSNHCTFLMHGSVSAAGGNRVPSCDFSFERAAPGTIYVSPKNSTGSVRHAILVSSSVMTDIALIVTSGSVPFLAASHVDRTCADNRFGLPDTRPAQHLSDPSSLLLLSSISVFMAESGHLAIMSDEFRISLAVGGTPISGLSRNVLTFGNSTIIRFSDDFEMFNSELRAIGATLFVPDAMSIGTGSDLVLHGNSNGCIVSHQSSTGCSIDRGTFLFSELKIVSNASLTIYNITVNISASQITVHDSGALKIPNENTIITLQGTSTFLEGGSAIIGVGTVVFATTSTVAISGYIDISAISVVVNGPLVMSSGGLLPGSYMLIINNAMTIGGDSGFLGCTSDCLLFVGESGSLTVQSTVSVSIGVPVELHGLFDVNAGAVVHMKAGADVFSTGLVTVWVSANLNLAGQESTSLYVFAEGSALEGAGVVVVADSGVLKPPNVLNIITRVHGGGTISFSDAGHVVKTWNISNITVLTEGWLNISTPSVTVEIQTINLSGGRMYILGTAGITAVGRVESEAVVLGSGMLRINIGATLFIETHSSPLTTNPPYLREVKMSNYGHIFSNARSVLLFGSAATIENFGNISVGVDSYWGLLSPLMSSFLQYPSSTYAIAQPIWSIENVSVDTCAELCHGYDIATSRILTTTRPSAANAPRRLTVCESFQYNAVLQSCKLFSRNVSGFVGSRSSDALRTNFAWDIYSRVNTFNEAPRVVNMPGGAVYSRTSASRYDLSTTLSYLNVLPTTPLPAIGVYFDARNGSLLEIDNDCFLNLALGFDAEASAELNLLGGSVLALSSGSLDTLSVFERFKSINAVQRSSTRLSYKTSLSGKVMGSGSIELSYSGVRADTSLLEDNAILLESAITIDPTVSLRILNSVLKISSAMKHLFVSSLYVDGGVLRSSAPIHYHCSEGLHISSMGRVEAAIDAVQTDQEYDCLFNTPEVRLESGGSLFCSRLYIEAGAVILSNGSSISTSGRGYGFLDHTLDNAAIFNNSYKEISTHSGKFALTGSTGGSYGGIGGRGYTVGEASAGLSESIAGYGSYELPTTWGSPGGCSLLERSVKALFDSIATGGGGGGLVIHSLYVEIASGCSISSDGAAAPVNTVCGGGSGGSILLNVSVLMNHGVISSSGGGGGTKKDIIIGAGGGGGGGRVALYVKRSVDSTLGDVMAVGGAGFEAGSAGTVFKYLGNSPDPTAHSLSVLSVSNNGKPTTRSTHLTYNIPIPFHQDAFLDILDVHKGSFVLIDVNGDEDAAGSFQVRTIVGDDSGTVVVVNQSELSSSPSEEVPGLLWNYHGYSSHLSESIRCSMLVSNITMIIKDARINSSDIVVCSGRLILSSLGSSSWGGVGTFRQGLYKMSSFSVLRGSTVLLSYEDEEYTDSGCPPGSSVILINVSSQLSIDSSSRLHSDYQGCFGSISVDDKFLIGGVFGGGGGGGGGHGGEGGSGLSGAGGSSSQSRIVESVDSLYHWKTSLIFGSGGGGTHSMQRGGRGGGVVHIVADEVQNNGTITANGGAGQSAGTGGGSGGGILLQVRRISGSGGTISASGGPGLYNSVRLGGPGGGGIVSLLLLEIDVANSVISENFLLGWPYLDTVTAYGGAYIERDDNLISTEFSSHSNGNDLFDFLDQAIAAADCADASSRIGPASGIVHIGWRNENSLVSIRDSYDATINITRSRNENGVEVFERVLYTVCRRLTELYSSPVENTTVDNLFIGNASHASIGQGSSVNIVHIFNDGTGFITIPEDTILYVPVDFAIHRSTWFVKGHVFGADNVTIASESVLSFYPTGRWMPCYIVLNYDMVQFIARSDNLSCPFVPLDPLFDIWPGRQNSFVFFSMRIVGNSGLNVKGGNAYIAYPSALLQIIGTADVTEEFYGLSVENEGSFISASGEGYSGEELVTSQSVFNNSTFRWSKGNESGSIFLCGYGGVHAGKGGYCYSEESSRKNKLESSKGMGTAMAPLSWGGGGGASYQQKGAAGGGSVHILISGHNSGIWLAGQIRADGASCTGGNCGSGAGGSLWIDFVGSGSGSTLRGSGVLSAVGGGQAGLSRSLAGAGGRIALNDINAGGGFSGTIFVHSGNQNVLAHSNVFPAAGTFYLRNTSQSYESGLLFVSNRGVHADAGTMITEAYDAVLCNDVVALHYYSELLSDVCGRNVASFDEVVVVDGNLVILSNLSVVAKSVISGANYNDTSVIFAALQLDNFDANRRGVLTILEDAELILYASLNISHLSIELFSGRLELQHRQNVTIGTNGRLSISQGYSVIEVAGMPSEIMASLEDNFGIGCCSVGKGKFQFSSLDIVDGGILEVFPEEMVCSDPDLSTHVIVTSNLVIGESSTLTAGKACVSHSSSFECLHCGGDAVVNGRFGAAGGGHAGYGTPGAFSTLPGQPRGQIFQPTGSGGYGGSASKSSSLLGGAGGGGLRVSVLGDMNFLGTIDVSGGSATGPGLGGGAGGSLWLDIFGSLSSSDTGILKANGGHGGLSNFNGNDGDVSFYYGGAGSGGRIHVTAGSFLSNGVSSTCELMFPDTVETMEGILHSEARGGLSVLTVTFAYEYNETLSGVFGEDILPYIYCHSCPNSSALLVAGAAGTVVYSMRSGDVDHSLSMNSWRNIDIITATSPNVEMLRNHSNIGSIQSGLMFSARSFVHLNGTGTDIARFSRISMRHGNVSAVVHNTPFSSNTGIARNAGDLDALGAIHVRHVLGQDAGKISFDSDVMLEPASCKTYGGCVSCPVGSLTYPELTIQSIRFAMLGSMHVGRSLYSYDAEPSLQLHDADMYISDYSRYLLDKGDVNTPVFYFKNVTLLESSNLFGEKLYLSVSGDVFLNDSSAIHADSMSTKPSAAMADIGASGGSHGGRGLPGINSYYYYPYMSVANETIVGSDINDTFDDVRNPTTAGSAGGSTFQRSGWTRVPINSGREGAAGGGVVRLDCAGSIIISGGSRISADGRSLGPGTPGSGSGGGGGAGGSVHLSVSTEASLIITQSPFIEPYDAIRALGGSTCGPMAYGGSGGGGRLSVSFLRPYLYNGVIHKISDMNATNPYLSSYGDGVLSGAHSYMLPAVITASAGLIMTPDTLSRMELPAYPNAKCGAYDVDKVASYNVSLWTLEQLTGLAVQPSHKGTVYSDMIPSAIPVYKKDLSIELAFIEWNDHPIDDRATYNVASKNTIFGDAIDVYLTERPTWVRETVDFCNSGSYGNFTGHWQIGYGRSLADVYLAPFASALDVLGALYELKEFLPEGGVNVFFSTITSDSCRGFSYDVLFFSKYGEAPVPLLTVETSELDLTSGFAIRVSVKYSTELFWAESAFAVSLFNESAISNIIQFSVPFFDDNSPSIAYWVQPDVLRVMPYREVFTEGSTALSSPVDLSPFVDNLYIKYFRSYPTRFGWFSSNMSSFTMV